MAYFSGQQLPQFAPPTFGTTGTSSYFSTAIFGTNPAFTSGPVPEPKEPDPLTWLRGRVREITDYALSK